MIDSVESVVYRTCVRLDHVRVGVSNFSVTRHLATIYHRSSRLGSNGFPRWVCIDRLWHRRRLGYLGTWPINVFWRDLHCL